MRKTISIAILPCLLLTTTVAVSQNNTTSLQPGDYYVSLGSSFAAGPGIDNQLGHCGRSDQNYAHLIAAELDLDLTVASCNGATIANILETPQGDNPLQIEAVNEDAALVTVTIGGNDIRYTASTFACSGTPASERCAANLDQDAIDAALNQLPSRLEMTFDAIQVRAPRAEIVLVAYPRVFPENATACSELELSSADTQYLADLGQQLQDAFVAATASGKALLADAYVRAEGHGPCDASERWVNGQTIASSGIRYHPTAEGHQEMARLVIEALSTP